MSVTPESVTDTMVIDDDGEGIDMEFRERVFEPFFRIDKNRAQDSGGFGLGLSIAKRIVDWHGGRIGIQDSPFGGTRVSICLPVYFEAGP